MIARFRVESVLGKVFARVSIFFFLRPNDHLLRGFFLLGFSCVGLGSVESPRNSVESDPLVLVPLIEQARSKSEIMAGNQLDTCILRLIDNSGV